MEVGVQSALLYLRLVLLVIEHRNIHHGTISIFYLLTPVEIIYDALFYLVAELPFQINLAFLLNSSMVEFILVESISIEGHLVDHITLDVIRIVLTS